ncbi:ring-exported protein (REX), putative [Plasmodium ovale wallikeri]|uniref:Ring-exported protein (REX), putative n=2 Tax=Plasmodium ovale TaxID=36330 RepID=A0A1A9ALW2_PLAOA|nr:ring-exported protein (REX), putative [Plasmodium ovale wallikeri]SBT57179.1 ring-exported protein (REX), putative [Plasmodium ovale wallikeri]SBT72734.1 ring-exported protein 3, putative [Plasmodium ovale]
MIKNMNSSFAYNLGDNKYYTVLKTQPYLSHARKLSECLDYSESEYEDDSNEETSHWEPLEKSSVERMLKEEWKELEEIEKKEWSSVIVRICQTVASEYDSCDDMNDKIQSWCNWFNVLSNFRDAEIYENNLIFENFLRLIKRNKLKNPDYKMSKDEEQIWERIKQNKKLKDREWGKYHEKTWSYWLKKEYS